MALRALADGTPTWPMKGVEMPKHTPDDLFESLDYILGILKSVYHTHVNEIAEEFFTACNSGEYEDAEALQTALNERVDEDEWVTSPRHAQVACIVSDHSGYAPKEYSADAIVKNGEIDWSVMAYSALYQDTIRTLGAIDVYCSDSEGA